MSTSLSLSSTMPTNSMGSTSSSPRALRISLYAERRKYAFVTPGISIGYWKARKIPACARSSGAISSRSRPSYVTEPAVTSNAGFPARTCASVLFPEPFGPMIAWISPFFRERSTPLRISFSPAEAFSPFMSSIAVRIRIEPQRTQRSRRKAKHDVVFLRVLCVLRGENGLPY